jgi:hypothetical protein
VFNFHQFNELKNNDIIKNKRNDNEIQKPFSSTFKPNKELVFPEKTSVLLLTIHVSRNATANLCTLPISMTLTPQGQFNACLSRAGEKTSYQDAVERCQTGTTQDSNVNISVLNRLTFGDQFKAFFLFLIL